MKPASEQAGAPAVPGWSGRLILNLSLFALAFMLGVVTLFVHVNTTSAFVRSFAEARTATVPLGLFFASATLTPFGLNVFMQRYGKKAAAPLAIGVGFAGAMTCFAAAGLRSLGLIVFGSMLQGVMFAYILSLRFVAASICPPSVRPRAMSFVIGAACVSGVIARELSIVGRDWLPVRFAGARGGRQRARGSLGQKARKPASAPTELGHATCGGKVAQNRPIHWTSSAHTPPAPHTCARAHRLIHHPGDHLRAGAPVARRGGLHTRRTPGGGSWRRCSACRAHADESAGQAAPGAAAASRMARARVAWRAPSRAHSSARAPSRALPRGASSTWRPCRPRPRTRRWPL